MSWKFILSLFLALIVAVFAIQNADPVGITLLIKKTYISQALVILISAIFGALVVAFLGLASQMKLKADLHDKEETIEILEEEIEALEKQLEEKETKETAEVVRPLIETSVPLERDYVEVD